MRDEVMRWNGTIKWKMWHGDGNQRWRCSGTTGMETVKRNDAVRSAEEDLTS